jgi:putative redox protein
MEMLLSAIGACTAADVVSILAKKRQRVTAYRVEVKGERREEFPRRYQAIHIHHIVTGHGVSQSAVASAVELSDQKYCSVAASLRPTVRISTSFEIIEEADHARTGDA